MIILAQASLSSSSLFTDCSGSTHAIALLITSTSNPFLRASTAVAFTQKSVASQTTFTIQTQASLSISVSLTIVLSSLCSFQKNQLYISVLASYHFMICLSISLVSNWLRYSAQGVPARQWSGQRIWDHIAQNSVWRSFWVNSAVGESSNLLGIPFIASSHQIESNTSLFL